MRNPDRAVPPVFRRAARFVRADLRRGRGPGEMGRVHGGAVGVASGAPRRGDRQRDLGRGDDVPRHGRHRTGASAAGSRRPPRSASPWTTSTRGENDYLPGEAIFPASVTFVFGNDSLKLGAKRRDRALLQAAVERVHPVRDPPDLRVGERAPGRIDVSPLGRGDGVRRRGAGGGGKDDLLDPPSRRRFPRRLRPTPEGAGDRSPRERPPPLPAKRGRCTRPSRVRFPAAQE